MDFSAAFWSVLRTNICTTLTQTDTASQVWLFIEITDMSTHFSLRTPGWFCGPPRLLPEAVSSGIKAAGASNWSLVSATDNIQNACRHYFTPPYIFTVQPFIKQRFSFNRHGELIPRRIHCWKLITLTCKEMTVCYVKPKVHRHVYNSPRFGPILSQFNPVHTLSCVGRDNVVGIATCYGLDGTRSNPGGSEFVRTRPDQPWGPSSIVKRQG